MSREELIFVAQLQSGAVAERVPSSGFGATARAVLRHRWPLLLLCGGLALAEAVALQVTGFRSALPLAPQISAPASFGAYHDLRWCSPTTGRG